jgi:RNA polymerase sigma-70 factor (ECF subfamily)
MTDIIGSVDLVAQRAPEAELVAADAEARAWLRALRSEGTERERAAAKLHAILLRAARFELHRRNVRREALTEPLEDLVTQSADNALVAILAKLDDYRFESRFTTWAYKFAILEAAVLARRRAWQERELPVDPQSWTTVVGQRFEQGDGTPALDRLKGVLQAINTELSPHQREVLTALVLADVPIDVLAERLNTTRGALYKTLHDARRKLRATGLGDDD